MEVGASDQFYKSPDYGATLFSYSSLIKQVFLGGTLAATKLAGMMEGDGAPD
jgi:hypothetical protein